MGQDCKSSTTRREAGNREEPAWGIYHSQASQRTGEGEICPCWCGAQNDRILQMTELESHCQGHSYLSPLHGLLQSTRVKELLLKKQQLTLETRISPLACLLLLFLWVKTLCGIAFRKSFGWARLQKPVTESMRMLEQDTARRAGLGFLLDTYGMDLSEYVFNVIESSKSS